VIIIMAFVENAAKILAAFRKEKFTEIHAGGIL
jgi:hypothetical protein